MKRGIAEDSVGMVGSSGQKGGWYGHECCCREVFISPRKNCRTAKGHINDLPNSSSVAQSKALKKQLNSLTLLTIKGAPGYLEGATRLNEDWFVFMWD